MKLFAKFEINFSGHLLFMLDDASNSSVSFTVTYEDFTIDVSFILDKTEGLRTQDNRCIIYRSNHVKLAVSKNEEETPQKENDHNWEYFGKRADQYRAAAIYVLNNCMRFFKYKLGNPLLSDITEAEYPGFDNPLWEDEMGNQLDSGYYTSSSNGFDVLHLYNSFDIKPFSKSVHFHELQDMLKNPYTPQLHEEILTDAKTSIAQRNYRRAVLEMAIACELYVKQFFFHTSEISSSVFDYLEEKRKIEVSVPDLLHSIAKQAFGESYKNSNDKNYRNIEFLFRTRNKIAHTGKCYYKNDEGKKMEVYAETLEEWWNSIQNMINWLKEKSGC